METIGTQEMTSLLKRWLSVAVIVALAGASAPSLALAQARGGHFGGSNRSFSSFSVHKRVPVAPKSVFPQPVDPWKFWGPPNIHKHHGVLPGHGGHGQFTPFVGTQGFIGTPSVAVSVPVATQYIDASTTVVYASPAPVAPAAGPVLTASAMPTPTLLDHPGGWYQLRGDGVTTPYSWVWIPKPPVAPAAAEPPQGSEAPVRSADSSARDRGPAYHWTDDGGVTTFTNRLERVPKRFRDQAAASAQPE